MEYKVEFKKGCPACEHTNPRLEQELDQLAQLLFDAYLGDIGALPVRYPTDPLPPKETE
jgi:hypothetical protein